MALRAISQGRSYARGRATMLRDARRIGQLMTHHLPRDERSASSMPVYYGGAGNSPNVSDYNAPLFKLVQTDIMFKELNRYVSSDAEHLGLVATQDVVTTIRDAGLSDNELARLIGGEIGDGEIETEAVQVDASRAIMPTGENRKTFGAWIEFLREGKEDLSRWLRTTIGDEQKPVTHIHEGILPVNGIASTDDDKDLVGDEMDQRIEKLAIKRTYQPSTVKRKRMHGFLYRAKTRLGKKILKRRLKKGRRRLAV